ncbi:DUF4806 domain-containing protein, partial [Aphis craccivora]
YNMWSVVSFDDENTVECVPNFWFKNNACAWPNKNLKNYKKAVEHCYNPNNFEYDYFNARLLSTYIGTLHEARIKARRAEVTSELSSANDDIETRKTRHRKILSSSEKTIKFQNKSKHLSQKTKFKTSILPNPPVYINNTVKESSSEVEDDDKDITYNPKQSIDINSEVANSSSSLKNRKVQENRYLTNTSKKRLDFNSIINSSPGTSKLIDSNSIMNSPSSGNWKVIDANTYSTNTSKRRLNFDSAINLTPGTSKIIDSNSIMNSPSAGSWKVIDDNSYLINNSKRRMDFNLLGSSPGSANTSNKKYLEKSTDEKLTVLLRAVTNLKYELRDYGVKIDRIENAIMNNNYINTINEENNYSVTSEHLYDFPMKTIEDLNVFEDKLLENTFRLKMINYLSRLEQPKISDMTRHIMAKLFHNNLLSKYSYVGQKKKLIFSVLRSCLLIFDTIRNIPKHRSCTDMEIVGPLKTFLANAKFREQNKNN